MNKKWEQENIYTSRTLFIGEYVPVKAIAIDAFTTELKDGNIQQPNRNADSDANKKFVQHATNWRLTNGRR